MVAVPLNRVEPLHSGERAGDGARRKVRTAVVPAAGLGTRLLPQTRAVPKELFPVGGKPAIEWVIEEALEAGIDRIVVVWSPRKPAIGPYLECLVEECLAERRSPGAASLDIAVVYQPVAAGLGDAVRVARSTIGDEPFAVLLPDEILLGGGRLLRAMLEDFERTGQSGVSLLQVEPSEIGSYGCAAVAPSSFGADRFQVTGCIEKPQPGEAPSCLAISGRYVLGAEVLDVLESCQPDGRGEVQLTGALDAAAALGTLAGFLVAGDDGRVDVGNWQGWLDANVRLFSAYQS